MVSRGMQISNKRESLREDSGFTMRQRAAKKKCRCKNVEETPTLKCTACRG